MDEQTKLFISPGAWFKLQYPGNWGEFEDMEGSFLFYNPEKWNGNFRISAFKENAKNSHLREYGEKAAQLELEENPAASLVKVDRWDCAYSHEEFTEEGVDYTTHFWIFGERDVAFECSFTVARGGDITPAEEIISSVTVNHNPQDYPDVTIPIRALEIREINDAYEWTSSTIKKLLKKDFTSSEEDIEKIQQIIDEDKFKPEQREAWEAFGLAFGTIIENEIDGMEWYTSISIPNEYPLLRYGYLGFIVSPKQMIWNKIKKGERCDLKVELEKIKEKVRQELEEQ